MPRRVLPTDEEKFHAKSCLLLTLKRGQVIYTLVRHTTRTGEWESIALFASQGEKVVHLTDWAAQALQMPVDRYGGIQWSSGARGLIDRLAIAVYGNVWALEQEAL